MATRSTPENYFKVPVHILPTPEPPVHRLEEPAIHHHYYYPAQTQEPPVYSTQIDPTTLLILGITAAIAIVGIIALMKK